MGCAIMKLGAFYRSGHRHQGGAAAVEFALIAAIFFTLLFGIVELGRFLYLFNSVQEVTRRAAREAVVNCTDSGTQDGIRSRAVLGTGTPGASLPAGGEITDARVVIDYLDKNQDVIGRYIACPPPYNGNIFKCESDAADCIKFVRVRVCDYRNRNQCDPFTYEPMIGLFVPTRVLDLRIEIPGSTVIMPAESLGYTFQL